MLYLHSRYVRNAGAGFESDGDVMADVIVAVGFKMSLSDEQSEMLGPRFEAIRKELVTFPGGVDTSHLCDLADAFETIVSITRRARATVEQD